MTKFMLVFDTEMFENPKKREELDEYFRGNQIAQDTARKIGWTKDIWHHNISSIFSVILRDESDKCPFGKIEELKI